MKTRIIYALNAENREEIAAAAGIIRAGGLVGLPTETVYGLGADGLNPAAVRKIYEAKGRPEEKPISLLIGGIEDIHTFSRNAPESAIKLAERFWPGPLTIVLEKSDRVPNIVTAGGFSIGLRCPRCPVTLEIIKRAGVPVAAPSANISGGPSARSADEVLNGLGGKIDAVVDGGPCELGVESTIVDFTAFPPKLLRRGGLSISEIKAVIGDVAL